jgi:hypothetical protein
MAKQTINIGTTANDGTGDPIRAAFGKVNDNFTEIYTANTGVNTGDQNLSAYATTAAVAAGYQPLDSDLTAISALTTTAYGRALLSTADAATLRSAIGVGQTDAPTFGQFITLSDATNFTYLNFGGSVQIQRESALMWLSSAGSRELGINIGSPIRVRQGGGISWWDDIRSGTLRASIFSTVDNIIEQRNGTAKQGLRVYNTALAGAPEWAEFDWITSGGTNTLRLGTNLSGTGAARPIEFVVGGVARMSIGAAGGVIVEANLGIEFASNARIASQASGNIRLSNNSATDFNRLQLGGTTSAFPAIKRNGTGIHIVLADDSGFAPLTASTVVASTTTIGPNGLNLGNSAGTISLGGTRLDLGASTTTAVQLFSGSTGSPMLLFGGVASSHPALKRSTTSLQAKLADDSAFTNIQGKLTTDTAYTATVVAATGYITIYDSTGTAYRVPCAV